MVELDEKIHPRFHLREAECGCWGELLNPTASGNIVLRIEPKKGFKVKYQGVSGSLLAVR